jgi:choline-sulfatase
MRKIRLLFLPPITAIAPERIVLPRRLFFTMNRREFHLSCPSPGKVSPSTTRKLVNVGVDTFPTMLDYAGLKIPDSFKGRSLKSVCEKPNVEDWRKYVVVSNHMVQGAIPVGGTEIPESRGRMLRTDNYKYAVYDSGEHRESLVDMKNDPFEKRNVARNPKYKNALEAHRTLLREYANETGDVEAMEIFGDS